MSLGYKDGNYPAESQVPVYTSSDVTASYAIKLRLKGELTLSLIHISISNILIRYGLLVLCS